MVSQNTGSHLLAKKQIFSLFCVFGLDTGTPFCYISQVDSDAATAYGGIAQLGERLNGIQEVSGSIPLISTKNLEILEISRFFSVFIDQGCALDFSQKK